VKAYRRTSIDTSRKGENLSARYDALLVFEGHCHEPTVGLSFISTTLM
jgi:hypothetical protein